MTEAMEKISEQNQKKLTISKTLDVWEKENPRVDAVTELKNADVLNKASDSVCATFCASLKSSSIFGRPSKLRQR